MTNIHRLFALVAAAALMALPAFPQNMPAAALPPVEVKGHQIGETLEQFMAVQGREARLRECTESLLRPKKRRQAEADECIQLKDGLAGKTVFLEPALKGGTLAEMTFSGDKLVRICLLFYETIASVDYWMGCQAKAPHLTAPIGEIGPLLSFKQVLGDLTAKFGPPGETHERQMQNGFGGIFTFPVANWTRRPDVAIYATQFRDQDSRDDDVLSTLCLIVERAYADSLAQSDQARPNALQ